MEVQEQRQREEESQRAQRIQALETAENDPTEQMEAERGNILTLTGAEGSSIINVSLTFSSRSNTQLRVQMPSQLATGSPQNQPPERSKSSTSSLNEERTNNSTPLMQLQRERARHHYELHRLDQRVGERLYGPGTGPYMSYMDDVVPVRVAPMPGMLPRQVDRPWSQATSTREERLTSHAILPEEELPTCDEVMQNENRYHPIPCLWQEPQVFQMIHPPPLIAKVSLRESIMFKVVQ